MFAEYVWRLGKSSLAIWNSFYSYAEHKREANQEYSLGPRIRFKKTHDKHQSRR